MLGAWELKIAQLSKLLHTECIKQNLCIYLGPVHMIALTGTSRLRLTDDLASYLFSYKILHCVHMRKRAGPLAEISFEFAEIIGRRDENFSI
jgi:hypothetical protein